jgi:tRNA(Ile)-lysidine synthetase-like protein
LLPALAKRFGVSSVNTILRTMALIGDESDYARAAAETWLDDRGQRPFETLHPAVQRHFVRQQLKRLGLPPKLDLIEQLRRPLRVPITAAPGFLVRRNADGTITRCEINANSFRGETIEVALSNRGKCAFSGISLAWSRLRTAGLPKRLPARDGHECFDAMQIGERIQLRHWRPGDQFQPIGTTSPKKLQDLFTNMKIPRAGRRDLVLAETASGEIFWVEGLRISERFKVTPGTRTRLRWTWSRLPKNTTRPGG